MLLIMGLIALLYFIPAILFIITPNSWFGFLFPPLIVAVSPYNELLKDIDDPKVLFLIVSCLFFPLATKYVAITFKQKDKINEARFIALSGLLGPFLGLVAIYTILT